MSEELQVNTGGDKAPCTLKNLMAGMLVCVKAGLKILRNIAYDVREWGKKDASKDVPQAIGFAVFIAAAFGVVWLGLIVTTQIFYWVGIIKMAIMGADINFSDSLHLVDAFSRKNPLEDKAIGEGLYVLGTAFYAAIIILITIVGGKMLCAVGQSDKKSVDDSQPE